VQETINPYEPPKSVVLKDVARTDSPIFFTTSTLKFVVMSICTFGLYELYWFYKNWVLIEAKTGKNIMPFWRAFFAPFWAYSCFKHVKTSANENQVSETLSTGLLAAMYFIAVGISLAPDPYWLVGFFGFVFIIPVNSVAVDCNRKLIPEYENNEAFTGWNWFGVVIGGLFLVLSLVGTFLPQEMQI